VSHANFSHDSKQLEVEKQQLIDARQDPRVWWYKWWAGRQVRDDGMWVGDDKAIVIQSGYLMQRIYEEKFSRSVLVFIEIDIPKLKRQNWSFIAHEGILKQSKPSHSSRAALSPR
jgi:hypothetical protein